MRRNIRVLLGMLGIAGMVAVGGCQAPVASSMAPPRSAPVTGGHVNSFDGIPLAYDARGAGATALVFVHGWCCNRSQWDAAMDEFADQYRVVALDLAGHGDSGGGRQTWNLDRFARDVEGLAHRLDLRRIVLVGHSMGGPVCLLAAARMPRRVIGVVGVDTLHDVEATVAEAQIDAMIGALEADFAGTLRSFVEGAFAANMQVDPALIERVHRDAVASDPAMAVAIVRSYQDLELNVLLAACPAPVRCINAAEPHETRIEANRRYASTFDAILMPGVGHFPMLETPRRFHEHLRRQIGAILAEMP